MKPCRYQSVWFDLDGTLLETAEDIIAAVNATLADFGIAPLPYALIRNHISRGSRNMMALGLNTTGTDARIDALVPVFGKHYLDKICVHTRWFDGMEEVVSALEAQQIPWGIITNKAEKFARPLVEQFGLKDRIAALVAGDTLSRNKPAPDPLRHAAKLSQTAAEHSIFIGDNIIDIQAGKAAGMYTAAAAYGYVAPDADPNQWGADFIARHPAELTRILFS